MTEYDYHKIGVWPSSKILRTPKVKRQEETLVMKDKNTKIQKLTRKEINIIFGCLYNLERFNEYTTGYLQSDYIYDVVETESQVIIHYEGTSGWKLPISVAGLQKETLTVSPNKPL